MKKIFIYYSLSGNGDEVAKYLKEKEYDIRKVETKKNPIPKNFVWGMLVGGFKAVTEHKEKLLNFNPNIEEYDEIIIGSPVWNARFSCPINTVLNKLDLKDKKVTFILYSGSGTSEKATEKINEKYSGAKIIDLKEPKKNKEELNKILI